MMRQNYNKDGGILPKLDDKICPSDMYDIIMMDGWSTDPEKTFNPMKIIHTLIGIKEGLNAHCSSRGIDDNFEEDIGRYLF